MKAVWWLVVLLTLAGTAGARAAPDAGTDPVMPDPCRPAPNLPFCK